MLNSNLQNLARRAIVWLLGGLLATGVALAVVGVWHGWAGVQAAWGATSWGSLAWLAVGTLGMNALRFLRWPLAARRLGLRVPLGGLAHMYAGGIALSATPGKLGTAVRLYWLHRDYGVPYARSAPLMLLDVLTDALGLLIITLACAPALGAVLLGQHLLAPLVVLSVLVLALVAMMLAVILHPTAGRRAVKMAHALTGRRWPRLTAQTLRVLARVRQGLGVPVLAQATGLAAAGWLVLGLATLPLLTELGLHLAPAAAPAALGLATLLGGLTLLPAGLGGTEVSLATLYTVLGASWATAAAATALVRLVSTWLPVAVGLAILPTLMRKKR